MKKITLLLFVTALPFFSCSSDESDQRGRNIKANIDGNTYIFNTLVVEQHHYNENGFEYTDVEITGSINNDPSRTISIIVMEGATGHDASWYFAHFHEEEPFVKDENFITHVTESDDNYIKGTFSGTLVSTEDGSTQTISDGSFEVTYN